MPPTVGQEAPPFTLPDQDGTERSLQDWRGRWLVLYFYPKDDTPGCTTEACDFSAGIEAFRSLDTAVVGVSPDAPTSHRRFIEKHELRVTLLSDPDHAALERYGAWGEKTRGGKTREGVLRSTVLIDPAGRVAHHWPHVSAKGHAEAVRQKLDELR